MSIIDFDRLKDSSRLWIFGIVSQLNAEEIQLIGEKMNIFVESWVSHKAGVHGGWTLKHDRFILIGADESGTSVSGCSIDSMVGHLRDLERQAGSVIADSHPYVFYRGNKGQILALTRSEFTSLAERGEVNEDTVVFDNTIKSVEELRSGAWEIPVKNSWHRQLIGIAVS
jgi:hypothetical protein